MTADRVLSLAQDVEFAMSTLRAVADELRTAYPDAETLCDSDYGAEPETPTVTLEDVRALLSEKSRNGRQKEVKALLAKYGADKLSAVAPENYAALLAETKELK